MLRIPIRLFVSVCIQDNPKSLSNGSSNGASFCACAALNALVSIDLVLGIAFLDCANGTSFCARTASDALVGNLVCHRKIPPYFIIFIKFNETDHSVFLILYHNNLKLQEQFQYFLQKFRFFSRFFHKTEEFFCFFASNQSTGSG